MNAEEVGKIRMLLEKRPRDLLLFELATQTGIKLKKLLELKVNHLVNLKVGEKTPILDDAPDKFQFVMNEIIHEALSKYLKETDLNSDDYLFKSRKGQGALNLSTVSNLIKGWFREAQIGGNHGARSLYRISQTNIIDLVSKQNLKGPIDSMKFLEPIKTLDAQEIIYKRLFEAIISGKIPPGTRMTVTEISKRFNVSQTPVRVALNWLEARGFLISQKKRASIVKELSLSNIKEIMSIRLALETFGVKLACKFCSEETVIRLDALIQDYEATDNIDEFQEIHNKFHQTLYTDANMPLLQKMIRDLCYRVNPYFVLSISNLKSLDAFRERNVNFHRRICEEMRRRNPQKVSQYVREDLTQGLTRLEKVLSKIDKKGLVNRLETPFQQAQGPSDLMMDGS